MSEVLDGIIKANKHELLKNFISDMEDLEVRNSALVNKV